MKKLLALFILLLFSSISVSAMEKVKHEGSIMNEELKITDPDFYEISNHFIYEDPDFYEISNHFIYEDV